MTERPRLESSVERAFVRDMLRMSVRNIKLNLMGNRSYPDRLIFLPRGRTVLIEFKRPDSTDKEPTPDPLQEYTQIQLRKLGHDVRTFNDADKAKKYVIEKIKEALASAPIPEKRC